MMRVFLLVVCSAVTCPLSAQAQVVPAFAESARSQTFKTLVVARFATAAFDVWTTQRVFSTYGDRARENNPMMRPFVKHPAAHYAAALGVAGLEAWIADRLRAKGHPTLANYGLAIGVAASGVSGAFNLRF